jgi:hypothetical protein
MAEDAIGIVHVELEMRIAAHDPHGGPRQTATCSGKEAISSSAAARSARTAP